MSTTLLFAELIIIGLQVMLWMGLIILGVLGNSGPKLADIKDWQGLIVLAVLACSYTIGTLFDRFADLIFSKWNERLRRKIIPNPEVPIVVMRYTAAADNEYLNRLFEYTRSRLRIARASALNFPLISMGFLVYFWPRLGSHAPGLKPGIVLLVAISGVLLTGLALFSWQRLTKIYFQLVRVNYDATTSKSKPEPPGS